MKSHKLPHEFPEFNREVRSSWETNADFWNDQMGEGNSFHNTLIRPSQEKLLALEPEEKVLDIACGNGHFARQIVEFGVTVVGIDVSTRQIQNAVAASREFGDRLHFMVGDATDESILAQFGKDRFDAISCGMAIMDMAEIEPLAASVAYLLKPTGRFVFTTMHPAFNSPNGLTRVVERTEQEDGAMVDTLAVKITSYIKPESYKGVAILGQPVPQRYFHRPISILLNVFFEAGFVVDRIEEPVFGNHPTEDQLNWDNYTEIPPVLAVRLRLKDSIFCKVDQ